ncbi:hypothetical protein N7537_005477 [Penicillium hordei]|uniref:Nucleoside phosphorylase domain-containing protein n=1 Tax=Penicillium hordei TaxID=40994 RepID=A0AAD6E666_9EURO|nr:uncharacterized protein N7537_005477 [Penicillium hordei]KAJ5602521.1 hypothetical protein N7537_005477 [Penicillium hordei]
MRPRDTSEFGIAIICALPLEADPIEALFDEAYDRFSKIYGKQPGDQNTYITGRIGLHNVVLCYMPGIGRSPVASVASSLRISFTGVQLALVVGICGAAPYPSNRKQIFLGDVIISDSIVQYDFGRQYPGGFDRKKGVRDILGRPSQEIRALLNSLQRRRSLLEFKDETSQYLDFESSFAHKHYTSVLSSRWRSEELYELQTQLLRVSIYERIVVLQGPPGIGKSSLAAQYVEEFFENYSAIFWLDASSPSHLERSFSKARAQIQQESHYVGPIERVHNGILSCHDSYHRYARNSSPGIRSVCARGEDVQAVQRWLSRKNNNHWLLIFDNYPSMMDSDENDERPLIERFFPDARHGHMVVTTRSSLPLGHTIRLEKIKCADEGLKILAGSSGKHYVLRGDSCRSYLDLLEQNWSQVQEQNPRLPSYGGNLDSCWEVAFAALRDSPDVHMGFSSWVILDSSDAWFELFARKGTDKIKFNRAMMLLRNYGVVEHGPIPSDETLGSRGYNMQKTFHTWLQNRFHQVTPTLPCWAVDRILDSSRKVIDSGTYFEGLV